MFYFLSCVVICIYDQVEVSLVVDCDCDALDRTLQVHICWKEEEHVKVVQNKEEDNWKVDSNYRTGCNLHHSYLVEQGARCIVGSRVRSKVSHREAVEDMDSCTLNGSLKKVVEVVLSIPSSVAATTQDYEEGHGFFYLVGDLLLISCL